MKNILFLAGVSISSILIGCNGQPTGQSADHDTAHDSTHKAAVACAPGSSRLDVQKIEKLTGMKGASKNGEYKITVPQNDLNIVVDGFKIIPPMGLGTWIAFTACADSVMAMGDLVLTETDLKPVQAEVIRQGFQITAIHNHFLRNRPAVMYMHVDRAGDIAAVCSGAKAILDKIKEVRGHDPKEAKGDSAANTINIPALDSIVGYKGEMAKGVYKYTIGRPDVPLTEHGIPVSTFMGFNTWAAWQGTPEKAAVAGDFTML
ncbi:MAG: DUF1259 domain-containing protein, partial [Bacteroidetes bacterium]|nr:DUF1259 domain-containing protein [Bacteroidota bacterium]